MTSRALIAVALPIIVIAAVRAQRSEQEIKAYVENLRGRVSDATFANGHYEHAGIRFDVPGDWTYQGTIPDANPADDTVHWTDPKSGLALYVYMSRRPRGNDLAALLDAAVTNKAAQRARQGYRNWRVRTDSLQRTSVNGTAALIAVADLGDASRPRVERLTWLATPAAYVEFFVTMNPDQMATFGRVFDGVVQSARLP
jgi:hypothetical protein